MLSNTVAFAADGARLELELLENEYGDGGFDSEMEYAEYINQRDSEYYVTIKSPGENDSEDYEYYTPEDMYDLLGK